MNVSTRVAVGTRPSAEELIAHSEAMIPRLKEHAAESESTGKVSKVIIDEMIKSGISKIAQPARWGGYEMSLTVLAQTIINLARGDHSVGWCHSVYSGHAHHLALFDDRAARDVWKDNPDSLVASPYNPQGTATPYKDGYKFKGQWRYSSGCDYVDWYLLGGFVDGDASKFKTFLLPKKDVEILDDWRVMGLKGTGSKSVRVTEAYVPEYRTVPFGPGTEYFNFPGLEFNKSPAYRIPYILVFNRAATAAAIGGLAAMIDEFCRHVAKKISVISQKPVAEHPDTQLAVGEAVATLKLLKIVAIHDLSTLEGMAARNAMAGEDDINEYRYRAQEVAERAIAAARQLFELSGGGGLYDEETALSRIYRNLIGQRNHPAGAVYRDSARAIGALMFGKSLEKRLRF